MMGWVVDFNVLDVQMRTILGYLDHQNLNDLMENPTAENLAVKILKELQIFARADEFKWVVRVWETPKCWAEVEQT